MREVTRRINAAALAAACALAAGRAEAQTPAGASPPAMDTPSQAVAQPVPPAEPVFPPQLEPRAGGITADSAALRAIRTSYQMRAAEANIVGADAARAEAGRALIPTVNLLAQYTRYSTVTPGVFTVAGQSVSIPAPLSDVFDFRGTLTLPLTDLPLRLARVYEAAGYTQQARRLDAEGTRLQTGSDARVAFYEYLRAVGQLAVAAEGLTASNRHHDDLQRFVQAGTVARVELLRVDAQVAESERLVIAARNTEEVAEAQLRQRLHMAEDEGIVLGEAIEGPMEIPGSLADNLQRAWHDRPEVASLERQTRAAQANLSAQRAAYLPTLTGVLDVDALNPNPRIVPQTQQFSSTWDATLRLTWSPTSALVNEASMTRLAAQRDALAANVIALRESTDLEVRNAWSTAQGARASVSASERQLASAQESYRVRRERFLAGAAISSDLTDAELDLVRARLAVVNANMDLREALARLRRAIGEPEAQ